MDKPNHLNIILRPAQHVIYSHHACHEVERCGNGDMYLGGSTQNIIIFTVFSPLIFFTFLVVCALAIYLFAQRHLSLDHKTCDKCPGSDASPLLTEQQYYDNGLSLGDTDEELLTDHVTFKGHLSTDQPIQHCRMSEVVINMNGTSLKCKDKFHSESFSMDDQQQNKKSNYITMV